MSREKQIEDIANILWHIPNNYFLNSYNDCERIAECIYDDGGYRKQSKGEWELGKSGCMYFCSFCGYAAHPREVDEWTYCPNCGAKMKGGAE